MIRKKTLLVVPSNDTEAILIADISEKIGLEVYRSSQPHGARLEKETGFLKFIKNGNFSQIVIVEMPGLKIEKKIRDLGLELTIIDHHYYTNLDRAHDLKTGNVLLSSLEQFLKIFRITDEKLRSIGMNPKMVRGVGVMDRGYVWALYDLGWKKSEVKKLLAYQKKIMKEITSDQIEKRKKNAAQTAWKNRKRWQGFWIIQTDAKIGIRDTLSLIVALEIGARTPLIIYERRRGMIYIQESPLGMSLFRRFGGFIYGMAGNWGYLNDEKHPKISLRKVKKAIIELTDTLK